MPSKNTKKSKSKAKAKGKAKATRQPTTLTDAEIYPPDHAYNIAKGRELTIVKRLNRRDDIWRTKRAAGEALKEEGNALFRKGKYEAAVEKYIAATAAYGPRAVYLSNLAAALLKLDRFHEAEDACSEALFQEPDDLKARFRRGMARKGLGKLWAPFMVCFEACLDIEPGCEEAQKELKTMMALRRAKRKYEARRQPFGYYGDSDEESDAESDYVDSDDEYTNEVQLPPWDTGSVETGVESDTSDHHHYGNDIPCKDYNHDGCQSGRKCKYKHAPDDLSIRDRIGQNLCTLYLLGLCKLADEDCAYSHDESFSPSGGGWWWHDDGSLEKCRRTALAVGADENPAKLEGRVGKWLSGAPRRGKYHLVAKEAGVEDGEVTKDKKVLRLMQILHGPSPGAKVGPHGFTDEEVLELRCQGVRPWDEDALDVISALEGC